MPYIFGKLWHLAIIWAIRKAFQCILQGVRFLLANQTLLSGTSENESYIYASYTVAPYDYENITKYIKKFYKMFKTKEMNVYCRQKMMALLEIEQIGWRNIKISVGLLCQYILTNLRFSWVLP